MLALGILLLSSSAFAGASEVCPSAEKIKKSYGQSCHQNSVFAQSAFVCLKRIQQNEALLQAQLNLQLAAQLAASQGQASALAGQVTSLTQLTGSLGTLETQASEVEAELKKYAANLNLPGAIPIEQIKALGLSDFFAGFPCYAQNQASLSDSIATVSTELKQIQNAKASAEEMLRKTSSVSGTFTGAPSAGNPAQGVGASPTPPAAPAAPPQKAPSDITGTTKKKDDF